MKRCLVLMKLYDVLENGCIGADEDDMYMTRGTTQSALR